MNKLNYKFMVTNSRKQTIYKMDKAESLRHTLTSEFFLKKGDIKSINFKSSVQVGDCCC